jgi:hypothetical protein
MPNWCQNNITVRGSIFEVLRFVKVGVNGAEEVTVDSNIEELFLRHKVGMESYYATPKTFKDADTTNHPDKFKKQSNYQMKTYGVVGWYDWNCKYLGTKWASEFESVTFSHSQYDGTFELVIWFDTAWSPPVAWLEKVQADFPKLYFRMYYEECGMEFCGIAETLFNDTTEIGEIIVTDMAWADSDWMQNPDNQCEDDDEYTE